MRLLFCGFSSRIRKLRTVFTLTLTLTYDLHPFSRYQWDLWARPILENPVVKDFIANDAKVKEAMGPAGLDKRIAKRLQWWLEARFGMFIHWGIYAVAEGRWKGRQFNRPGEWIMHSARVPVREYARLAERFNPVRFDAGEWVDVAKRAGMKYLVITAKHHDGFAMYDSPSNPYNVVKATPWGRDPMKELAKACEQAGIPFGFYYSQTQDWYEKDAAGNTWDYKPPTRPQFRNYLERKVKPQLRELLTQYGPIAVLWFDTPRNMDVAESQDLKRLVHKLQPDCLVSGRVGNNLGDYGSLADNQVPRGTLPFGGAWETPATLNDTWAYKRDDQNWKSARTLIRTLVDSASKNVNYLLNIGPKPDGTIPKESISRLVAVGTWLRANGEAIYRTQESPFPYEFPFGRATRKGSRLYLHLFDQRPRNLKIYGLRTLVKGAAVLGDTGAPVFFSQRHEPAEDIHELRLELPTQPLPEAVRVIELELAGNPDAVQVPIQQENGSISLPALLSQIHGPRKRSAIRIGQSGVVEYWSDKSRWVSWRFRVREPASFTVRVILGSCRATGRKLTGGHRVAALLAGQRVQGWLGVGNLVERKGARHFYFQEAYTDLGTIIIDRAGTHDLKLKAVEINHLAPAGIVLSAVELIPQ